MGKANNALWQKKNKMKHPYDERTSCRTSETYKHPLIIQTHRLVIIIMEKSIWHMIREKFQFFWVIFFSSVFFSGDSGRNEQWWIGNWYIHYEFICPCSFCMYCCRSCHMHQQMHGNCSVCLLHGKLFVIFGCCCYCCCWFCNISFIWIPQIILVEKEMVASILCFVLDMKELVLCTLHFHYRASGYMIRIRN